MRIRIGWLVVLGCIASGTANAGQYLDPCNLPGDCTSGLCVDDLGGAGFCSRTCTLESDCADEHLCVGGKCVPDDTGRSCSQPSDCVGGLCAIPVAGSGGRCTRACTSAALCPAGYACTPIGSTKYCVRIEQPCASSNTCPGNLCLPAVGCTAYCTSAADCPARLPFLPAYSCAIAFGSGQPICVPPGDIQGPDAIGTSCSPGTNTCRSGACDTAVAPPACTQVCNTQGACGPDSGCVPESGAPLVCRAAGSGSLGSSCTGSLDCQSGLCLSPAEGGVCTRLCEDGLCPTGFSCSATSPRRCLLPEPGFVVSLLVLVPFAAALASRRRRGRSR